MLEEVFENGLREYNKNHTETRPVHEEFVFSATIRKLRTNDNEHYEDIKSVCLSPTKRSKDHREISFEIDKMRNRKKSFEDNQFSEKLQTGDVIKNKKGEQFYVIHKNLRHEIGKELYDEVSYR